MFSKLAMRILNFDGRSKSIKSKTGLKNLDFNDAEALIQHKITLLGFAFRSLSEAKARRRRELSSLAYSVIKLISISQFRLRDIPTFQRHGLFLY